jgi:hypothetical protein
MVRYKQLETYEAATASLRMTGDGDAGVIYFAGAEFSVALKRNALLRLRRQLVQALGAEAPSFSPRKVADKRGGGKKA